MLLSAAFVYFRDMQPIWDVLTQLLFYASPVIIPWDTVHRKLHPTILHIYEMSPLAVPLQQFRHAFANPHSPSAAYAVGAGYRLFVPIAIVIAVFALGFYVFNRVAPRVAEIL
jgi:ABC-2 type transport system permease protein